MDPLRTSTLVKREEDYRDVVYLCPGGFPTGGWGHKLMPGVDDYQVGDKVPQVAILRWFEADMEAALADVESMGPPPLGDVRHAVLVNMAFCMGRSRLAGFVDMLTAVRMESWGIAADELLDSLWQRDLQGYAPGKETRADRLARMMRTGKWPEWLRPEPLQGQDPKEVGMASIKEVGAKIGMQLLETTLPLVLGAISPMLVKAIRDAVRGLRDVAAKTDSKVDDILVGILCTIVGIED